MRERLERVRERALAEVEGFLVSDIKNVRYLTGFTGSSGFVLVLSQGAYFVTDGRYDIQAREEVPQDLYEVVISNEGLFKTLKGLFKGKRLGFEPEAVTYSTYEALKEKLGVELVPLKGVVYSLRKRKAPEELELMKKAQEITDWLFSWVLENLEPGKVTERDLALEMEYQMRKRGADGPAFASIVASGPGSALPHYHPGEKIIDKGVLLLDFGAQYRGYASDMTRTIYIGKPSKDFMEAYEAVLEAQERGIEAARVGALCKDVDAAAREALKRRGLEKFFVHGLGHGVGLDVHELPRVSYLSEDRLEGGEVITVEPGVYFEGRFGIRIEDMVFVDEEPQVLTGSPKALISL